MTLNIPKQTLKTLISSNFLFFNLASYYNF